MVFAGGTYNSVDAGNQYAGLFRGGGLRLLGVQLLGIVAIAAWSATWSYVLFTLLGKSYGIRVSKASENGV